MPRNMREHLFGLETLIFDAGFQSFLDPETDWVIQQLQEGLGAGSSTLLLFVRQAHVSAGS